MKERIKKEDGTRNNNPCHMFSGKTNDWVVWKEKYLAKAKKKGYKDILVGDREIPEEQEQETKEEIRAREDAEDDNEEAYSDLILSMADTDAGNVAFSIIRNAKTKYLPDGDSALAWKNMEAKYSPKTAPTEMSLYNEFHSSKLQRGDDPDIWLCRLEDLRFRLEEMGTKMQDRIFLMHILNNLTPEYE